MILAADRRAIHVYLLVTWTVSSLFYFLIIKSAGTNTADGAYTSGLMWCSAIGALLTCKYQWAALEGCKGHTSDADSAGPRFAMCDSIALILALSQEARGVATFSPRPPIGK
jgi:hypothetical protein